MREPLSREQGVRVCAEARGEGKRVVFTNGCFDLVHAGHVSYLQFARDQGDLLIVGVNDDDSVHRLKGEPRPFIPLEDRAAILLALRSVDHVVPFSEDTPFELISALQPNVLVKGEDYTDKEVVGRDVVEARGGRVVLAPILEGRGTSELIAKIRSRA
jgi:rfaE bifunctional protein nucleotidyltransferase chain/domain